MAEVVLVLGGAVLGAVLTWILTRGDSHKLAEAQKEIARLNAAQAAAEAKREADRRIDEVVQRYAELFRESKTGALHGLLVAGIKNLRSSEEIRLARERATAQTGHDPLRQYQLDGVDLKEFIDACRHDRLQVTNNRDLLERFGKK